MVNAQAVEYDEEVTPEASVKECAVMRRVVADAIEEDMTEEEQTAWRIRMEQRDEWIQETYMQKKGREYDEKMAQWDCETVISTYSNAYNHPNLISEGGARGTRAVAVEGASDDEGDSSDDDEGSEGAEDARANAGVKRNTTETPEEKRARKQAIKSQRKVCVCVASCGKWGSGCLTGNMHRSDAKRKSRPRWRLEQKSCGKTSSTRLQNLFDYKS